MQDVTLDHATTPLRPPPRPVVLARPSTRAARPAGPAHQVHPSRPALLAGEDLDTPDQHVFRGTD